MDVASLVFAFVATLIALGGLWYTRIERRERLREVEAERNDRREQIELLRRQIASDEREQRRLREADVRCVRGGRDGLGYSVELRNVGVAPASRGRAWLASPDDPQTAVSSAVEFAVLAPNESTGESRLLMSLTEAQIRERPPLVLVVAWDDAEGAHERVDSHSISL